MADVKIEEFYQNFFQEAQNRYAYDDNTTKNQIFTDTIGNYLEQDSELSDIVWSDYVQPDMETSGYSLDEERGILTILGSMFFQTDNVETLTREIYERKFKKLKAFFVAATNIDKPLYKEMEETDPAYETAREIFENFINNSVNTVVFFIITNGILTRTAKEISSEVVNGKNCDFQVFDINRIYQIAMQENNLQEMEIDMTSFMSGGLVCLQATTDVEDYSSYLTVLSGTVIAKIYDMYGQKLLEQNVRTFLQFKKSANKGMQITIKEAPERFFAYNNGLTCTSSSIEFDRYGDLLRIKKLKGLQIVNGGQTTSVIYDSYKKKNDVSKIFVQMKLSVVTGEEKYSDFVSKVARYANTQNPVKESDFFSNSPFHKLFKELSERTWTPVVGGKQTRTKWFYERTRGQYINDQIHKSDREKNEFLRTYPKEQMLDKIVLAKTEVIFNDLPYIANRAQAAFSRFANIITNTLEKDELAINENYFKEAIAKIILAKATDKIISNEEWYKNKKSVKSEIKAYSLSFMNEYVKSKERYLNLLRIWDNQSLTPSFEYAVNYFVNLVKEYLEKSGDETDLREKLKREYFWKSVKEIEINLPEDVFEDITSSKETVKYERKEAKKQASMDSGIGAQAFVVGIKPQQWKILFTFFGQNRSLLSSSVEYEILSKMAKGIIPLPSDKQSAILKGLYEKAQKHDVQLGS